MPSPIDDARAAGYSDDEIGAYLAPKIAAAKAAGYSDQEIQAHLGIAVPQPFTGDALRQHGEQNLAASPQPVTSLTDALQAGWQLSTAGLVARGTAPTKTVSPDAPMYSRIAGEVAEMAGDLPAMAAGMVTGAAGASFTGPGAAIGGMAGAMALPTALRATLMDAYTKGQAKTLADIWPRASAIMMDTAKSWITGAATAGAGMAAKAGMQAAAPALGEVSSALASPTVAATTKTAAEIATMTTVGKALDGQTPTAQDFVDAAIMLGGLHIAGVGAAKLRDIYTRTGIPPQAVAADAARDVTIQQDLASDKPVPDAYQAGGGAGRSLDAAATLERNRESLLADAAAVPADVPKGSPAAVRIQEIDAELAKPPPATTADRLNAIDEELTGSAAITAERRADLLQERTLITEGSLVPAETESAAYNAHIESLKSERDYIISLERARSVAQQSGLLDAAVRTDAEIQMHLNDALEASGVDLERQAQEHGVDITGDVASRSLEDLENEYQQAQAAGALGSGSGGGGQSGPPGGPPATGEGGAGSGGRALGPPGSGGPQGGADDAERRILAHISIGEAAPTRGWSFGRLYTNVVNRIFPIEQAVTRTEGADTLPVADDPGKLARLLSGANGVADRFIRFDTLDFGTRQPNGASLEDVLAPVKDDLDGFRAYAAASRALELEGRGIKTGFDLDAAREVVQRGQDRYSGPLSDLIGYQDRVAAYLRDAGVLSAEGYAAMREANRSYVPFQRVIEKLNPGSMGAGSSVQPSQPVHAITGSERMVIDPIESVIRNTYLYAQMAERNVVGTKLVDLLLRHGEAESTDTPAPPRASMDDLRAASGGMDPEPFEKLVQGMRPVMGAEVRVFRDGTPETYRVDPELAAAVKGLDAQNMDLLSRLLRPFSNTLRAGAVLQPDFMARHTLRDFLYAVVTGRGFFSPLDMVRGFASLIGKDEAYQDWLSSGGANASMVSFDRRYLQSSIDDLTGTGLLERAWNVVQNPEAGPLEKAKAVGVTLPADLARKFVLSPLQAGVHLAESATHMAEFIRARREAMAENEGAPMTRGQALEAGFRSRDIAVDAARIGASMRTWNAISAFSNIAIQDTDRVVRAFAKSPLSTALKVGGAIALPSALVWLNGHDDPRYRDAPEWERDLFWVVPTDSWRDVTDAREVAGRPPSLVRAADGKYQVNDGVTLRIPKPWGMGLIFGSLLERSLDSFVDKVPDAYQHFLHAISEVSVPNMLPNAVVPIIEQFANRSTFTNRTLIPDQLEKALPEYQYTPYTTQTARALGQLFGAFPGMRDVAAEPGANGGVARALSSPILLENYLRAWTGNLGMYALQAADLGLRKSGALPDPAKPASALADIPFVRAFIVRYPTASAQSIQDFQDGYARNKVFLDTWRTLAKGGDLGEAARVAGQAPQPAAAGMTQTAAQIEALGLRAPRESAHLSAMPPGMERFATPQQREDYLGKVQQAIIQMAVRRQQVDLGMLDDIHSALAEHSRVIRDVYKNADIPPDEKRQIIDTAYWRMTELAQAGNDALRRAESAMNARPSR